MPGAALGNQAGQEPNAAQIYRRAFGCVDGLRPEDSGRLSGVATGTLDEREIDELIQQAGPALEAIREAAAIGRCQWEVETPSSDDLGKGRFHFSNLNIIRVACLSARRLDLPRPGCRTALDEFAHAERSAHPMAAMLVEPAWGVRHMVDRSRALRSMLRAGLAIFRNGEPAYRAVADPFGSGSFSLERRGKGYLIRSAMNDEGKPDVTLAVGDAA